MHRWYLAPRQSCSKGAGGLAVRPRGLRIFTENSISLSRCGRQRGSRYAIRAGRNLPDKEFRYLRTVIVTAAVYRGFGSELAPLSLTFRHRAGVRPYTSSCDFAEPCVFSKQSPPPLLCPPPRLAPEQGPLLPKLRGHFAEFLQHRSLKRLGMLYQSTCVGLGYGLRAGAVSRKSQAAPPIRSGETTFGLRHIPAGGGILTPFPSATALALALGARLTLRGLTLRRNPWTFGDSVSHAVYRYSCQHSRFRYLQPASRQTFAGLRNAPLPRSEDRDQESGIRTAAGEALQHAGDLRILALPALGRLGPDIAEFASVKGPHLHLVGRADRHHDKAMELGARLTLLAEP